jgi:hypothetical protein
VLSTLSSDIKTTYPPSANTSVISEDNVIARPMLVSSVHPPIVVDMAVSRVNVDFVSWPT